MIRLVPTSLLLASLLLFVTACGPTGTWSRHGAATDAPVYMAPAPQAIAKSLDWWIIREYGAPPAEINIAMVDALQPAAAKVLELVPNTQIVAMDSADAIRVEALRLSRNKASVDLSAPRAGLPRQLVTIDLHRYNGPPWRVTGANWWRFNEKQLREVHEQLQIPAAPEEPVDETGDVSTEASTADADDATDGDS